MICVLAHSLTTYQDELVDKVADCVASSIHKLLVLGQLSHQV